MSSNKKRVYISGDEESEELEPIRFPKRPSIVSIADTEVDSFICDESDSEEDESIIQRIEYIEEELKRMAKLICRLYRFKSKKKIIED